MSRALGLAYFALIFGGIAVGCSGANYNPQPNGTPAPATSGATPAPGTPVPSASPSGSPQPCNTPVAAGAQFIAIGLYIAPPATPDPTYGLVFGYALADSQGDIPVTAAVVTLRPGDQVQFVNVDPANSDGSNGNVHSAVGFPAQAFPATAYAFPAAHAPIGTTFSTTTLWSTGDLPSTAAAPCYSQVFTVPASGVYYFGDIDYYNTLGMRDVLVVSSNAPTVRGRALRRR
jgi:hypothetical protein